MNSAKISKNILKWYDEHRRVLPWRYPPGESANPYYVWLSEMMLQQTQVETVKPYFLNFIEKWPTVQDLASASLDDVLHMWQGLGYYARARNLHKCAQAVINQFEGMFPSNPQQLIQLPGIGPYASAAIAAIAFNYPATVVDGNVARIISRVCGFKTPIKQNQKKIYEAAQKFTPIQRAGDYAQALMDIGSGICTPRAPKCEICPIREDCYAYKSGAPELFPERLEKHITPTRYAVAFINIEKDKILLRQRVGEKMLHGLWELPGSDWYADSLPELPSDIRLPFVDIKHTFSHFHLMTRVARTGQVNSEYLKGNEVWCDVDALHHLALSILTKKLIKHVL